MKAVLLVAFLAVSGVLGSRPELQIVWDTGARDVEAPVTELLVSGEELKHEVIQAIDEYLNVLDQGYDDEISNECKHHVSNVGNYYLEINKKLPQIDFGVSVNFDNELRLLTLEFKEVLEIVNEGGRLSALKPLKLSETTSKIKSPLMKIKEMYMRAIAHKTRASLRYTLQQLFFGYKAEVLPRDFKILREWQQETFNNGYYNVKNENQVMEKNHRLDNLWTMVKQIQNYAKVDDAKDKKMKDNSTPTIWANFYSARNDFLHINTEAENLRRN